MRRTVLTFVLFIGASWAPDAGAGPLDPYVSVGCWSDQNQCGDGHNNAMLKSPLRLAVSPDGKTVYSSIGGGGIAWSTRDAATGAITPAGCIATSGCTVTSTVAGEATEIVVSPDGGNVYQATDGRLEVFDRDASTGALAYRECFNVSGDAQCTSVAGISTAYGVAISADGANVYVASRDLAGGSGYLQAFTRGGGGHLIDAGCFKANGTCGANAAAPGIGTARRVAVTPDGTGVYVVGAPSLDGTIAWFNRSGAGLTYGGCMGPAPCATDVTSYSEPLGIAISPDGHSVYVATAATFEAQLHHFERAGDNSLTSHECWTDPTRTSDCGDGRLGARDRRRAVGNGDEHAGLRGRARADAVTAFTRDATTGGLTPVGCVRSISDSLHGCRQRTSSRGSTTSAASSSAPTTPLCTRAPCSRMEQRLPGARHSAAPGRRTRWRWARWRRTRWRTGHDPHRTGHRRGIAEHQDPAQRPHAAAHDHARPWRDHPRAGRQARRRPQVQGPLRRAHQEAQAREEVHAGRAQAHAVRAGQGRRQHADREGQGAGARPLPHRGHGDGGRPHVPRPHRHVHAQALAI